MVYQAHIVDLERVADYSAPTGKPNSGRFSRLKKRQTMKVSYLKTRESDSPRMKERIDTKTSTDLQTRIELKHMSKPSLTNAEEFGQAIGQNRTPKKPAVSVSIKELGQGNGGKKARTVFIDETPRIDSSEVEFEPSPRKRRTESVQGQVRMKQKGNTSLAVLESQKRRTLTEQIDDIRPNDLLDIVKDDFWLRDPDDCNRFPVNIAFETDNFQVTTTGTAEKESMKSSKLPTNENLDNEMKEEKRSNKLIKLQPRERESSIANSSSESELTSSSSET